MRHLLSSLLPSSLLLICLAGPACAQAQPPIKSAQDAACRADAQNRVFSTPNPRGLSLYDLGAQIYRQCMARAQPAAQPARRRG